MSNMNQHHHQHHHQHQQQQQQADPEEEQQQSRCLHMRDMAVKNSRRVQFLLRALTNAGCDMSLTPPSSFISCHRCEHRISGALYHSSPGAVDVDGSMDGAGDNGNGNEDGNGNGNGNGVGIILCSNHLTGKSQDYVDTVISHELIHSFDYCRAQLSFHSLTHAACTEIRAANLSGECTWWRELKRGMIGISGHQPVCVRRRALFSILGSANCTSIEQAQEVVDSVFERCYKDVQPHGSIPW